MPGTPSSFGKRVTFGGQTAHKTILFPAEARQQEERAWREHSDKLVRDIDTLEGRRKDSRTPQEKEALTKELDALSRRIENDIAQHSETLAAIDKNAVSSDRVKKAFDPSVTPKKSILKAAPKVAPAG